MSLLTAIALSLFVIEMRIPNFIPIPGVKLGLANIITVYAVYLYNAKEVALLVLIKVLIGSIFSGSGLSIFYSLAGSTLCLIAMLFAKKVIDKDYLWIASVVGAIFHNVGQIIVAIIIIRSSVVFLYLPFLMVSGCIAGACTGLCAQFVIKRLKHLLN